MEDLKCLQVFLDANILFSAAIGSESCNLLWEIQSKTKTMSLLTSRHCWLEAQINIERKKPHALDRLNTLAKEITISHQPLSISLNHLQPLIHVKDFPVLAAAIQLKADVLITGDLKHFGPLFANRTLGIVVCTIKDFLLAGPKGFV